MVMVLISSNLFRQKSTTKTVTVSITCHVPLSINYSMTTTSQAVQKSAYCALRHFIPLFLKGGPRVIEDQSYEPLHGDSADLKGFLWD